jgi:succinate dehydrogenase / fumarate reductase, cytochrome b subunit
MEKALSFYDTTIGKKVVMALTGLVLFGFVIGHMLGNLQIFLGPEVFNEYAMKLHGMPLLLWGARSGLLIAVTLHIAMALALVSRSAAARPVAYQKKTNGTTSFAALTMKHTGFTLLFFIVYHLAHFTFPGVAMGNYEHLHFSRAFTNVVNGFSVPWVTGIYVVAMVNLGLHLYHGAHSLFQTMGVNNPLRNAQLKFGAQSLALFVTLGNITIPLAVLFGLVR